LPIEEKSRQITSRGIQLTFRDVIGSGDNVIDTHLADPLLFELALGTAMHVDVELAERHLDACPHCRAELRATREALSEVPELHEAVELTPAPPALRERLLASVDRGALGGWVERVMKLFDLGSEKARRVLERAETADAWKAGPLPGMQVLAVAGGPRVEGKTTTILKMRAGLHFPMHRHTGDEALFFLAGGVTLDDGRVYDAGDLLESTEGTAHDLRVHADAECIVALVQDRDPEFV
jgi:anti-sigma factor ChrR (cupin superfamily)